MKRLALVAAIGALAITASAMAASLSDEFGAGSLASKWKWHNEPKKWDLGKTKAGWLTIVADVNRNLWTADDASRLYQEVPDEPFDVETRMMVEFAANSVVAGLTATSVKDNNWVTLKFWGHAAGDAQLQFQTKQNENGNGLTGKAPGFVSAGGVADLHMRLTKNGAEYAAYWKMKEGDAWTKVGPTNFALTPPLQVSVYGGVDGAAGTMTVQYDYLRDNLNPLAVHPAAKAATVWANLKR
ncbi:hypothetical protein FJZ36_13860 [Candidatus Poribacteria bacterium]|nr:hypothetical protein [Candidatus Poribacteria bacterium]